MRQVREEAGGISWAAAIIAILVLLPAVYVLSLGPAVRLTQLEIVSEQATEAAYYPLILLAQNCRPVAMVLEAYVELWEPAPPAAPVLANPVYVPPPPPAPPPPPQPISAPAQ